MTTAANSTFPANSPLQVMAEFIAPQIVGMAVELGAPFRVFKKVLPK